MNSTIETALRSTKRRQADGFRPQQGGIAMRKLVIAGLLAATALVSTAAYAQDAGDNPTPPNTNQSDGTPPDTTPASDPTPPTQAPPVEPVTTRGLYRTCMGGFWTYVQTNSDDSISYYPSSEPCTSPPDDGTGLTLPPTEDLPVDSSSFVAVPVPPTSTSLPPAPGNTPPPPPSKGQHFSGPGGTQIFINPRGEIFVRFPLGTSYGSDLRGNVYIITAKGLIPVTEVAYHPDGSRNAVIFTPDGHAISVGPNGELFVGTNPQGAEHYVPKTSDAKTDTPPKSGGAGQQPLKTALPHIEETPSFAINNVDTPSSDHHADEHPYKSALKQVDDAPKSSARTLRSHTMDHGADLHAARQVKTSDPHPHLASRRSGGDRLSETRPFKGHFAAMPEMHTMSASRNRFAMSMAGPAGGRLMAGGLDRMSGLGGMREMRPMNGGLSMMHGEGGMGGFGGMRLGRF
jgi:hypothetical protein